MSSNYSTRITTRVLSLGALASTICFVLAIALESIPAPIRPQEAATLGVVIVIATPAASLVATALEYRGTREALVAIAVLGVLSASLLIAFTR